MYNIYSSRHRNLDGCLCSSLLSFYAYATLTVCHETACLSFLKWINVISLDTSDKTLSGGQLDDYSLEKLKPSVTRVDFENKAESQLVVVTLVSHRDGF